IGFGYYPAFVGFAGSQSISAATFQAMLTELMVLSIDQGARKLLLLNTGVTPAVMHMRFLGKSAEGVIENRDGGHADERETSMMLAIAPQLVHLERATSEQSEPFERSGATGDPRQATAAKGEALLEAMVEELVAAVRKLN